MQYVSSVLAVVAAALAAVAAVAAAVAAVAAAVAAAATVISSSSQLPAACTYNNLYLAVISEYLPPMPNILVFSTEMVGAAAILRFTRLALREKSFYYVH